MFEYSDTGALIRRCLEQLSGEIGPRPAGSEGQRRSEQYLAEFLAGCGLAVEIQRTDCPRWELKDLSLRVDGRALDAIANPYAPACHVSAPLVCVRNLAELDQARLDGSIAVLAGDLTTAPFNPRNFDIYRNEAQDQIISTLERKRPLAVVTVSGRAAPVPLIEDADFPLPSVTVPREVGAELISAAGQTAQLRIDVTRQASYTANIIARGPGVAEQRLIVCAHYDTKFYTPGAIDNASGVAALLGLAGLLQNADGLSGVEFVAFGGEDSWYPADAAYVRQNASYLRAISAVMNVDGVGVRGYRDSVTFLACPEAMVDAVLGVKARYPEITQVPPWYAGDHSLFWPRGIPSLAVTSERSLDAQNLILHTTLDTTDQVDPERIQQTVYFLHDVIRLHRSF